MLERSRQADFVITKICQWNTNLYQEPITCDGMIHKQDLHAMKEYKFQERDSVDPSVVVMFCRQASNSIFVSRAERNCIWTIFP